MPITAIRISPGFSSCTRRRGARESGSGARTRRGLLPRPRSITFNQMVDIQRPGLDRTFHAVADPTRRAILATLARGDATVGDLAARFPISLNGVSKHIQVLERAGLVERQVRGREHRLSLNADPLADAAAWLTRYRAFWTVRLDALERFLVSKKKSKKR